MLLAAVVRTRRAAATAGEHDLASAAAPQLKRTSLGGQIEFSSKARQRHG